MWWPIGRQPLVPAAGQDRRVPVFGAFNPHNGHLHAHLLPRKNSESFLAHLEGLRHAYPRLHILLFADNCSIHHSLRVQRYLADHRNDLTVIWNAAYTPELNLIERYWGHLKATATNNYFFGTVAKLEQAIRDAVRAFNRSSSLGMFCYLEFMQPFRKTA